MKRYFSLVWFVIAAWLVMTDLSDAQDTLRLTGSQAMDQPAISPPAKSDDLQAAVVHAFKQYSKAFEYADYPKIVSHFILPATFIDPAGKTVIAPDKRALIDVYHEIRGGVQQDYKYSLVDRVDFHALAPSLCSLDVTYGRFDGSYQRIHTGRGLYFFRKTDSGWKIYTILGIPTESSVVPQGAHVIQLETVYYTTGPQQGRAPDGKFPAGTVVTLLKESGSYLLVESNDGIVAYVSSDSVKRVDNP